MSDTESIKDDRGSIPITPSMVASLAERFRERDEAVTTANNGAKAFQVIRAKAEDRARAAYVSFETICSVMDVDPVEYIFSETEGALLRKSPAQIEADRNAIEEDKARQAAAEAEAMGVLQPERG